MQDGERGYGQDYGQDYGEAAWFQPPAPRRKAPRWLLIDALALAFALTLGVGAVLGSTILQSAQAAGFTPAGVNMPQTLASGPATGRQAGVPGAPGQQGQCGVLTVSSVSGQTIVAKAADGSTVTIHTTSSTQYTSAGKSASASAVKAGVQIHIAGTHNSDGSITATRVDIG